MNSKNTPPQHSQRICEENIEKVDWQTIESSKDCTISQTEKWCRYQDRIGRKSVILRVDVDEQTLAYFIGAKFGIGGLSILGAPIDGINTTTQGLVYVDGLVHTKEERVRLYKAIAEYVFEHRIALMLQVTDWQMREDLDGYPDKPYYSNLLEQMGVRYSGWPTLYVDMEDKDEEDLWAGLHYKSAKYSINKAAKCGLYCRQITDLGELDAFLDTHYDQLVEVCAKQGKKPRPAQAKSRMKAVVESLWPDRVRVHEIIGPDENGVEHVMATGIFCLDKGQCAYWTGASYQRYQKYCPNEPLVWEAMRQMAAMGVRTFNLCGSHPYKAKYGTKYCYVPRMVFVKYEWVLEAKNTFKKIYNGIRNKIAKIKGRKSFK